MKHIYTNEQLAIEYIRLNAPYVESEGLRNLAKQAKIIKESDIHIADLYSEQTTLKSLSPKGFSDKAIKSLEFILENGSKEAERIIDERKKCDEQERRIEREIKRTRTETYNPKQGVMRTEMVVKKPLPRIDDSDESGFYDYSKKKKD